MIPPARPPRRAVLRAAAALPLLGLAACTAQPREPEPAPVDPLADVLDRHVVLLGQYDAAISALPQTAQRLQPLREHVAAHVAALAAAQAVAVPSEPSSGAASSSGRGSDPSGTPAPADEPTTLAALAASETDLLSAVSPLVSSEPTERAPLLGSIAAAHAVHAAALA